MKAVFERIAEKYDGFGAMIYDIQSEKLHDNVVVFVNNRSIPKNLNLLLKADDIIAVTPYYSGG